MSFTSTCDADNCVTLSPANPTAAVIFLHGLGDTAQGWPSYFGMLADNELPHVKFIFPTAAKMPVTVNRGMYMPSWFDIKTLSMADNDFADGIEQTRDLVLELIDKEVAGGIPYDRIVLGGISQGGATSLFTGFRTKHALAGVLSLSGYLPRASSFQLPPEAMDVPVLMCHGEKDAVISLEYGQMSKEKLQEAGVKDLTFFTYPDMWHVIGMEELEDVKEWLQRILSNK